MDLDMTQFGAKQNKKRAKARNFVRGKYIKFHYIMAGHAIVVVKDINLLFYHGNAVILTLW